MFNKTSVKPKIKDFWMIFKNVFFFRFFCDSNYCVDFIYVCFMFFYIFLMFLECFFMFFKFFYIILYIHILSCFNALIRFAFDKMNVCWLPVLLFKENILFFKEKLCFFIMSCNIDIQSVYIIDHDRSITNQQFLPTASPILFSAYGVLEVCLSCTSARERSLPPHARSGVHSIVGVEPLMAVEGTEGLYIFLYIFM